MVENTILITVEGLPGCGKSTFLTWLKGAIDEMDPAGPCYTVKEKTGEELGTAHTMKIGLVKRSEPGEQTKIQVTSQLLSKLRSGEYVAVPRNPDWSQGLSDK